MIGRALDSELFKLLANRWATLAAFGGAPLLLLAGGLLVQVYDHAGGDLIPYAAPLEDLLSGFGFIAPSIGQMGVIVGASILFAGEYRWETWRAILPRTSRPAIITAKLCTFALAAGASVLLCALASGLVGCLDAALTGRAVWPAAGAAGVMLAAGLGFLGSFLQLLATGAAIMSAAVLTRSMTAAIVGPFLGLVLCEIASIRAYGGGDASGVLYPNIAGASLRQLGQSLLGDPDTPLASLAPLGALSLVAWISIALAPGLIVFFRQDMTRE